MLETPSAYVNFKSGDGGEIIDLTFALQEEVRDSYENEFWKMEPFQQSHPPTRMWLRGGFRDMEFSLKLAAGVGTDETAKDLINNTIVDLFRLAMPRGPGDEMYLVKTTVTIGGMVGKNHVEWFRRPGVVKSVDFVGKPPWEIISGRPSVAEIKLVFIPHFSEAASYEVQFLESPSRQPNRKDFKGFT